MGIDLNRFHQVFFAESLEQLDAMEAELLRPTARQADNESINTIFRAAHSIKGGSATFGFGAVAGLTHVLETLLDEARDGKRRLDSKLIDLLLQAVDALRACFIGYQSGEQPGGETLEQLRQQFESIVGTDGVKAATLTSEASAGGWQITFAPHPEIMLRGNDPYRLLRELDSLGTLHTVAETSELPDLEQLNPEHCYLSWSLRLEGEIERDAITEIFEWVADDCELSVEPIVDSLDAETEFNATMLAGNAQTVRVGIDKIDQLINLVGELVITESMLARQLSGSKIELADTLEQLARNVSELQDSALNMRMLPISFGFARLPRIVRDLSRSLDKQVRLQLEGESTEVDKSVLESLTDPLTHLVRNAIDHGIEPPAVRAGAGKPSQATVTVRAYHEGGSVVVEVADDGAGLNSEQILRQAITNGVIEPDAKLPLVAIHNLIFRAGFSTSQQVSDISGRGVGLDVVRNNVQDLGGTVGVQSEPGAGTQFTLTLPLTLSIIDGQLVRIGERILVVPMLSIVQNLVVKPSEFESVGGQRNAFRFRETIVPVADLAKDWDLHDTPDEQDERLMVITEAGNRMIGLLVDELLEQQQIVIKSLEANFRAISGVSAATILGDGAVALILDIAGLIRGSGGHERRQRPRQSIEMAETND